MAKLLNIQQFIRDYSSQTDRFGGAFGIALQIAQKIEPPPPPPPEPEPEPQASPDTDPLIHEIESGDESTEIGEGYGYSLEALETMNPDLDLEDNPGVRVEDGTLVIDDKETFDDVKETVEPWDDFIEADGISQDIADGKSVDIVADERGLTRQEVLDQLEAGGFEVETSESTRVSDDMRTTEITHPETGETVTVHYDKPEDTYRVSLTDENGEITSSPQRDDQGRKITTETDDETGATTTRYEDDLGDGTIIERTELPNGVEIERTTDAEGETTTVVTDKDGNQTTLEDDQETTREGIDGIAEAISEGKSIGEIAEQQGVTREQLTAQLEAAGFDLVESSDELNRYSNSIIDTQSGEKIAEYSFTLKTNTTTTRYVSADGIETRTTEYGNEGRHTETITEANGRETTTTEDADGNTTVEVTSNGYTLTTPPDGNLTLRDNEGGTEIEIERDSPLASLVETYLGVDPESSDPQEAQQAEVIQTVVESMLAGERIPELSETVEERQKDKQDAVDKYGEGQPGTNATYENPYGDPPVGTAPSGGEWVPMNGVWMDPEVAKAIAAENTALAELIEAQAMGGQAQAQLEVFALDPDYADAIDDAGAAIDEALAPHGLQWTRPEAEGSLEDAQARLDEANTRLEDASEAKTEFQNAEEVLDEAITEQENMPFYPDGTTPVLTSPDSDYNYQEEVEKGEAAQAEVDALFYEAALHNSKGNDLLAGYTVSQLQTQLEAAEPDTELHKQLEEALEQAEAVKDGASNQLDAAQAYYDFYAAKGEAGQLTLEALDLKEQLLEDYNARNDYLFEEGKEHFTVGGDYLGELSGQEVVEREGQLWVINHFEDDNTTEQQLTIPPNETTSWWEENRDLELNRQWHELVTGSDPNACGTDGLSSIRSQELIAGRDLNEFLQKQLGVQTDNLDTQIGELEEEYNELFEQHGPGTIEAPEGMEDTETINIGGIDIEVSPQTKEAVEEQGLDALITSGEQVRIEIDGEQRWVNPELAVSSIALDLAREQRETAEQTRQQAESAIDAQIEMYDYRLTQPIKLLPDSESAEHEASLQYDYLDENEAEALGQYQPYFQGFIEGNEYTDEFSELSGAQLETQVANALQLDADTTQGRETLDKVTEEIHDLGGENPDVRIVPITYIDDTSGQVSGALFAVKNEDGDTRYVDATGKHFENLEDFQDNNEQFREDGKLIVPTDLEVSRNDDGTIALDVVQASNVSVLEKVIDPVIGIGTGLASIGMFIPNPLSPVFAWATYSGAAYLGARSAMHQWNHIQHGGEWGDKQSVMNTLSIATTLMPIGSSGLRTFGMARHFDDVSRSRAFLASIGATKQGSELAEQSFRYMSSGSWENRIARGLDWTAIGTGVPMMAASTYDLAVYGDQMSGLDKLNAVVGFGTGLAGTGLGAHGLRMTKPNQNGADQSPVDPNPDTDNGPSALSAAYHPEGTPYPEQPSPIPAAFRKPQPPDLSEVTSSSPWRLPRDLTTTLARYPTPGADEAMAAIDPTLLQSSLIEKGVSPETAQLIAAEFDAPNSPATTHQAIPMPAPSVEPLLHFASELVPDYRPAQLKLISEAQIPTILPEHLAQISPGRMTHFTPEQVAAFTKEQLAALTNEQVRKLTPRQLEALAPEQIAAFTPEQLGKLRPKQIKALTTEQVAALTPDQVAALTDKQTAALSTEQWQALTSEQLGRLGSEQLQLAPRSVLESAARPGTISITLDADGPVILLHGLNRSTLSTLLAKLDQPSQKMNDQGVAIIDRAVLEGVLTPRAKGLLPSDAQLRVRAADNTPLEQGGKFQKTAIASALSVAAAVGAALSPYPTANALAYAWRGASFVYRANRPGATDADPIHGRIPVQGRILRGVEFFTHSINTPAIAMSTVQGQDPWVNGNYAVGNTVYATKTFMETVTGKQQFHKADDFGLPVYLFGSFPFTSDSISSFSGGNYWAATDIAAGSLFGGGSIYLWYKDSKVSNKYLKPLLTKFTPFGKNEPSMANPQGTELLLSVTKPTPSKRQIAFAITIGGGLIFTSMSAFGKLFDLDESDPEPSETPSPDQPSETSPPEKSEQPDQPNEPTPEPTQTQFVVTVPDGLNLRNEPSEDAVIVTSVAHGTFINETGPQETDSEGNVWLPVSSVDPNGNEHKGWVMARYLDEHAEGAMGENGRINPDLESQDYDWAEVERNDTLSGIAVNNDHSVDDVVELNDEHILDPDILYPGDRVYLPE